MKIEKKAYILEYDESTNVITLYNSEGGRYLDLPASALLTETDGEVRMVKQSAAYEDNCLRVYFESKNDKFSALSLSFLLHEDSIEVSLAADAVCDVYIQQAELFRCGRKGMYMVDCVKRFAPAPRNNFGVNRAFENVFCDCTMNAYFAPPPLNFCVGNRNGWVAFGLLDLPDSYEYRLTAELGVLVENRGGKLLTRAGTAYRAPRLLITFPKTDWESVGLFRDELAKRGLLPELRENIPAWWKKPSVVTYGDQMMELQYNWYSDDDWGSPAFTTEWLDMWLARAEEKLGLNDFTIVIDAFWQYRYSAEARVDESRFKDLRGFIDKCHQKGHRVLLWSAPLIDNPANGFDTLAQKCGVLSSDRLSGGIVDGKYYIDFTSDNIAEYFSELSRLFFSSDPDALDCDGLKMDFLANLRNPAGDVHYQNPENGIGIKEMYRFYNEFQKAAQKVKADVLLNGSACDPRFESVMAMNRLHDIQNVYEERELRAKVSAMACPHLLIDSDGAIMLSEWVKETYISAVVYSTPSLYYVNMFHDGVAFNEKDMRSLGALLDLSGKKTDGAAICRQNGNWQLVNNGRVTAECFDGTTVFVYDGNGTFYIFSWDGGALSLPAYDYSFHNLPENCSLREGRLEIVAEAGRVYRLEAQ